MIGFVLFTYLCFCPYLIGCRDLYSESFLFRSHKSFSLILVLFSLPGFSLSMQTPTLFSLFLPPSATAEHAGQQLSLELSYFILLQSSCSHRKGDPLSCQPPSKVDSTFNSTMDHHRQRHPHSKFYSEI
ncbi:hypothetical protein I3760_01G151100 [Carya illinoinensis]|nr:hypothetical protein I3760_01G151100 [Carya illinoinensis]